jgi:hypothetical protein
MGREWEPSAPHLGMRPWICVAWRTSCKQQQPPCSVTHPIGQGSFLRRNAFRYLRCHYLTSRVPSRRQTSPRTLPPVTPVAGGIWRSIVLAMHGSLQPVHWYVKQPKPKAKLRLQAGQEEETYNIGSPRLLRSLDPSAICPI